MKKILVADDDQELRESLKIALEDKGYEVKIVSDGFYVIKEFENGVHYDLLLSDNDMLCVNGEKAITYAKKVQPSLKTIMLSGGLEPHNRVPLDAFIEKGKIALLFEKVDELLY